MPNRIDDFSDRWSTGDDEDDLDLCSVCGDIKDNDARGDLCYYKAFDDENIKQRESLNFDKFMDDIVLKEHRNVRANAREDTPQRLLAKRCREMPHERIRMGGK